MRNDCVRQSNVSIAHDLLEELDALGLNETREEFSKWRSGVFS